MKKLLGIMAVALLAVVWTCQAVDYNNHFYNQRVYRVALGSGTAPAASDMALIGLHNGDMVLNTDDDCLYIMHATNVYTKMTSAGTVTLAAMSVPLASNKVFIGNSAGAANEKTLSGLFTITTGGVASATTTGNAVTGVTATAAVTPQAPATVTPTITVTPQTGAVTASGANNLVTITNYFNPVQETVSLTDTNGVTALVVTNITWSTAVYSFATNGVVVVTVTGGDAVMTNATAASSALPNFATNATAAITVTITNATFVKP
jgi:hypothetical protein